MKLAIITHTPHGFQDSKYFAYAPYVREINIWGRFVQELIVVAPLTLSGKDNIRLDYEQKVTLLPVEAMNLLGWKAILLALLKTPRTCRQIYKAMDHADHIHLRCPGNMGLLGCLVQIFFPGKPKTAKYAGNWDPNAQQPLTYKLQRWILRNPLLTRNMSVLVYGQWPDSVRNVKPFFTATYRETDKFDIAPRDIDGVLRFLFVGTLSPGKRPMYALELINRLRQNGHRAELDFYGEGVERHGIESFVAVNQLTQCVRLHGNQTEEVVRNAYQSAHFLLLPSKSEGWPKVVAEAMFWGCLPAATSVSCVPYMLDQGNRGILLELQIEQDAAQIASLLAQPEHYRQKALQAIEWSRHYTLDLFEAEIGKLLQK